MAEKIKLRIINKSGLKLPEYKTACSAGIDLMSASDEEIILKPMQRTLVKTGLFIQLPDGFEAQVRPRSGMALKHGITVLNTPGTIDSDYRGEIGVILINLSDDKFSINKGDRIAQLVIASYVQASLVQVSELEETIRGEGGFGSTGRN